MSIRTAAALAAALLVTSTTSQSTGAQNARSRLDDKVERILKAQCTQAADRIQKALKNGEFYTASDLIDDEADCIRMGGLFGLPPSEQSKEDIPTIRSMAATLRALDKLKRHER
jgi:hypothetical protein